MKRKKSVTRTPAGYKTLQCKYCENICERVDLKATAITCWKCTQRLVNGEYLELRK